MSKNKDKPVNVPQRKPGEDEVKFLRRKVLAAAREISRLRIVNNDLTSKIEAARTCLE
jgi:hypothetical protein